MDDTSYLRPAHPWRPVDWRWRLALHLVEQPRSYLRKYADDGVRQAVALERTYPRSWDNDARERLANRQPTLWQARELYYSDPAHSRWAVEARILAGEPVADIARKHNLTPEVIDCYAPLFFDVADRLDNPSLIYMYVVGTKVYTGWSPDDDLDVIWRLFGYNFGPIVLDLLIPLATGRGWLDKIDCPDGLLDDETRLTLKLKMAVALRMPTTPYTLKALLDLWLKIREKEQEAREAARVRAGLRLGPLESLSFATGEAASTPASDTSAPPTST
jgi:hypothetical protein